MALAVIVVMAVVVQLSHALEYKVGDSIGRNTVGNVDYKHHPPTNTFHHGHTISFDGSNDEIGSLQLTTGGGDKEELDSDPQRHKKRIVLTFSRTSPISETEIRDFFRKYGVIRSVYMQQGLRPRYAHIVFHSASSVKAILGSVDCEVELVINNKKAVAKKL